MAFTTQEKNAFYVGAFVCLASWILSFWLQQLFIAVIPFVLLIGLVSFKDIRIPFMLLMLTIPFSFNLDEMIHIGIDFPDEPLMLLLTALFVFFVLLNYEKLHFKLWVKNPLLIIILISFCWMIITVIFSTNPILSSKYLVKRIWYLVPFLVLPLSLFQDNKAIQFAYKCMFIPLLAIIVIVLYRYSAFGFRFEKVHDPIQPFFINHVMYGSMISCFLPLVVGAFFLAKKLSFNWLFLLLSILIFLTGIYFSYSRAAWMAVIFSAGTMVFIRFKLMPYMVLIFYTLVLTGVFWLSNHNHYLSYRPKFEKTVMHQSLNDHILATIQGTDISSAERYYRWIAAIRMSTARPLTGVGPNNFYENYKAYTISAYKTWVSRNMERSTTHNYFLFMLVEQGYPAMILYALLILAIFYYGQKVYHRQKERFKKVVVMSVLCMIAGLFINNFFSELLETDKIGSLFLLGIAVIVAIDYSERNTNKTSDLVTEG